MGPFQKRDDELGMTHCVSMFYQMGSQPAGEPLLQQLPVYPHRDPGTRELAVCSETAITHRASIHGADTRATLSHNSHLRGDPIRPEGRCNYMQPSSALCSIVMATRRLWAESRRVRAAVTQGHFNALAVRFLSDASITYKAFKRCFQAFRLP